MKGLVCYIPIEVLSRELDYKIYLALKLLEQDYKIIIGRKSILHLHALKQRSPFIIFSKGMSIGQIQFYKKLKLKNAVMLDIKEEGGFFVEDSEILDGHDNEAVSFFDYVFLWGDVQKKILEKHKPKVFWEKFVVTGYPSFDLLENKFIKYYKKLSKRKIVFPKDFILINTNFGYSNCHTSFSQLQKLNESDKSLYTKKKLNRVKGVKKNQEKNFHCFIDLINQISNKFPLINIVVRPHPTENEDTYIKLFKTNPKIMVNKEGSVREWIVNAKMIIHHDCTTGIESAIIGKPVVSYCPLGISKFTVKLPIKVSKVCASSKEVIDYYNKVVNGKFKPKNIKFIKKNLKNYKESATQNIIKLIEESQSKWFKEKKKMSLIKNFTIFYREIIFYYLYKFRGEKKISQSTLTNYLNSKFPGLSEQELKERIFYFCEILNVESVIQVKKITKDLFSIEKLINKL